MARPSTSDIDRFWLAVCVISLLCYLVFSRAIPEFVREVIRLIGRI